VAGAAEAGVAGEPGRDGTKVGLLTPAGEPPGAAGRGVTPGAGAIAGGTAAGPAGFAGAAGAAAVEVAAGRAGRALAAAALAALSASAAAS